MQTAANETVIMVVNSRWCYYHVHTSTELLLWFYRVFWCVAMFWKILWKTLSHKKFTCEGPAVCRRFSGSHLLAVLRILREYFIQNYTEFIFNFSLQQ